MTAPILLRTKRLTLRPFQDSDVEDALSYRDDPEFARFLPHIPQPFTRRDAEVFVALNMSEPWARSPTFAVVLEGTLIGTVNFEVDADLRAAMLGYAIGRAWWGEGSRSRLRGRRSRGPSIRSVSCGSGRPRTRVILGHGGCWKSWGCSLRQYELETTEGALGNSSTKWSMG